ncbi:MAG: hypothetical protein JST31_04390 [Actinobacteria bacterium]|nr:hypothetical protein [Actinomycetota bacterium]
MGSWTRRQGPALAVACLALMVALGGSVYAAAKIDGRAVKPGSLPGDRLEKGSVAGNRLKPETLRGSRIEPGSLTGREVDATTLGEVPEAVHAESAGNARTANTALAAGSALEARTLNGHTATCAATQRLFAGGCWEVGLSPATKPPLAAASCADRGGTLPDALTLAAFSALPETELAVDGEWSGDVTNMSGPSSYAVVTVSRSGQLDFVAYSLTRPFRCVIPLLH